MAISKKIRGEIWSRSFGLFITAAVPILLPFYLVSTVVGAPASQPRDRISYLDNGVIRLGVDLDLGGAITWLSKSGDPANLVNSHDWGRQIQMSFYSGPIPFTPDGKQPFPAWRALGWNPIQSGDHFKNRSRIIEQSNDGKEIRVKCVPMQWPLDNVPGDCIFESHLSLVGNTVHADCKLLNARDDPDQYPARHQELPAVYANGPFWRLMTYSGDKPFTHDSLIQIPAKFPWTNWKSTENWAALVNDQNWGVGIWEPGVYQFSGGFSGKPGAGDSKNAATGYIAPLHLEILDRNIEYDYSYVLVVGTIEQIREYVYDHAVRPGPPEYRFGKDRQHWHYHEATDRGWPIRGELDARLGNSPQLIGPSAFWQAADAPKVRIEAAFEKTGPAAKIRWTTFADDRFTEDKTITFSVKPDGEYHIYDIALDDSPKYAGAITGLRLDPIMEGEEGRLRIRMISAVFKRN